MCCAQNRVHLHRRLLTRIARSTAKKLREDREPVLVAQNLFVGSIGGAGFLEPAACV